MTRNEKPVNPSSIGLILATNQSLTCWTVSPRKGEVKALAGLVAPLVIADTSLLVMNAKYLIADREVIDTENP